MRALKPLDGDSYTKNEYIAYISQSYRLISGSQIDPDALVTLDIADEPPSEWTSTLDTGLYNSASGVYSHELFQFLKHAFYSSTPIVEYGTESIAATKFTPTESLYVFNIANRCVGEGISPGTVSINVSGSNISMLDDGYGRLYVNTTGSVVGNIFYKHGLVVVKNNFTAPSHSISTNGLHIIPYRWVDINFSSSFSTIEHTIVCKLRPTEFNASIFNPSIDQYRTITGSYVSASNTVIYKNLIPNVTSSAKAASGENIVDLFQSGTLTPYVTSIGLYDVNYNLVAIARLANPVPRAKNIDQTFIIKFDT